MLEAHHALSQPASLTGQHCVPAEDLTSGLSGWQRTEILCVPVFSQWYIFAPLWLVEGMKAKKGRMMIEGGTVLFPMRTEILCSNWGWQDRLTALPNPYPHSNCRMGCLSASYLFHIAVKGKQIHCSKYHASRWEAKTCCLAGIFALFFCFGKGLIPWDSGGWVTAVQALNSLVFYCQNWIKCKYKCKNKIK